MASYNQKWYMDTGATSHLSSHTGNLQTSFPNHNYHSVIVENGSSIPVIHSGHVQIPNSYRPLHLRNVHVTPNIIKYLVSVRKFTTDNKCSIDFDPYGFTIRDYHTLHTLLRCDSTGDLYPLHVAASAFALLTNNHSLWHQRLGHPGDAVIQTLSSRGLVSYNKNKNTQHLCRAYDNLDTSPIALRLLTTPTSPQQTPPQTTNPQTTPQTNPQTTPQSTPPTPLSTPSPQTTPTPPTTPPPPPPPTSQHPMVTRSKVGIVKANPKYNLHVTTSSPIPKSPFHALRDPNWKQAMCDEYKALIDNNTWVLVPRPPNVNIVRSMWLYKHKYNADGSLNRYKARLVANGRSQQQGIDCDETFSPVVKPATIRTVLSLAVSRQWPIHQLDVKNAFLHGHLTETVYMHQPPGFTDSAHSDYVCLLQKSLYGLKQAPRAWFQRFSSYVIRAASSTSLLQRIISSLHAEFAMIDLSPLNYFLGISATRTTSGIFLSQKKYATEILKQAHMLNCTHLLDSSLVTRGEDGPAGSTGSTRGHILNGMSDSLFDVYTNVESAKELWDLLESNYMAGDSSSKKFLDFKHTLKHGKDDLSLVQLGSHLRIEESLRAQDSDKGKGKEVAGLLVGGSNKKPKLECWKCGKTGHFKRDCRSGNMKKRKCWWFGKGIKDRSKTKVDAIAWWIDFGATTHIVPKSHPYSLLDLDAPIA
ncbi:ribonuclease H-like domain-containing protein [Tanacetum coccineum]